jgi:mycobactin polyketide synthetase MbtD
VVGNEITRTERSGLMAMEPKAAIEASLCSYDGDPLIFDADFERLQVFFESQGVTMPFSASRGPDAGNRDVSVEMSLAETVRAELAATLHLNDSLSINLGTSLIDLGVDSLLALDLRKRLRRTVGNSVPVSRMLGGITVTELIDALRADPTGGSTAAPSLERAAAANGAHPAQLAMLERLDS